MAVTFTPGRTDNRIRGRKDVADLLDRPVLAVIPPAGRWQRRRGRLGWQRRDDESLVTLTDPDSSVAEAYRALRIKITQLADRQDVKTILVTSMSGEGDRSTTASNLAVALAESGRSVLLVSADLRRPRLHQLFSLPNGYGLSNILADDALGSDSEVVSQGLWSVLPNLFVLASGPPRPDPSALLGSDTMHELLKAGRDSFDFVILDCPPAQVTADSLTLAPMVDAVLVVTEASSTDRQALQGLREQLNRAGGNIVGAVLDRSSHHHRLQAPSSAPPTQLREWAPEPPPETRSQPASPDAFGVDTAAARLVLSLLSLTSLVVGVAGYAYGLDGVRLGGLLVFTLIGVGSAPWQTNKKLDLPARLTLTMLTGFAVLTFVSVAMLAALQWRPMVAFIATALACVPLHLAGLQSALKDARASGRHWRPPVQRLFSFLGSPSFLCAVAGGGLCLGSALTRRHLDPGFFGFLPEIGIAWYVGLAFILLALTLSRQEEERQIAVPVLLLLVVLTLTPALVYDGPRSQVAAKHVDLILQIRTLHRLDAAIDIYNSWPGFFAATAWLCDIVGIRDPTQLATFWPPLIGLFKLVALRYLFGQVLRRPHQAWIAVALAVLADPIGADYFSPQSVGLVVGIAIFALALSKTGDAERLLLILMAGWVLAMSHQLSPYGVGAVLAILVVFKQVRPWWTPLLVLAPAVLWAVMHRGALSGFISLEAIGRAQNFRPPRTIGSPGLERLPVVRETVLALVLGIGIVGGIALLALLRNRRELSFWALACCPAAGLALVAVNPYGQEGIFRAAIFGIPWLALLAGHCFLVRERRIGRVALLAVTSVLTGTFLVAAFGLDATNVMRPSDLAAFRYFYQHSSETRHYILALGEGDLPTSLPPQTGGYESIRRDELNQPVRQEPDLDADRQVRTLTAQFLEFSRQRPARAQLYAVWSPVSSYYGWAYGLQTPDQFAALRDAFRRSRYWTVVFHQDGTYLFRFDGGRYAGGAA